MAASVASPPSSMLSFPDHTIITPTSCPQSFATFQRHRPSLSLDTSVPQQNSERGNIGLRLDTLSAVSPTIRNTFKNSYEVRSNSVTPASAVEDYSSSTPRADSTRDGHPQLPHTPILPHSPSPSTSPTSLPMSPNSSSSSLLNALSIPYPAPSEVRSILINSPFQRKASLDSRASESDTNDQRPQERSYLGEKRVSFRQSNLTEEIHTMRYTANHYELLCSDNDTEFERVCNSDSRSVTSSPRVGNKRDSFSDESDQTNSSDQDEAYPKTPVAGRRKKRREWVWTLGRPPGSSGDE